MDRRMHKSMRTWSVSTAALVAALALSSLGWVGAAAGAPGGNSGDVKIHDVTDDASDNADNPKPCDAVLVAFNFSEGQYTYEFVTQPGGDVVIGPTRVDVTTDPQQEPGSGHFALAPGQYKLRWDPGATITNGSKQKVFKITCEEPPSDEPPPGVLEVTKTVSGPGAWSDWAFDATITCTGGFTTDVVLSDEEPTSVVKGLDAGTTCTVDEANSQGAKVTYAPGPTSAAVPAGGKVSVSIDNSFPVVGDVTADRPGEPAVPLTGVDLTFTG